MKAKVTRSSLLKALTSCSKAIQPSAIHPVLSNYALDFRSDVLQVMGSNLRMTIMSELNIEFGDSFACLVPAKTFLETIKSLPEQPLELHLSQSDITVKSAQGVYKMPIESINLYPDTVKLAKFQTAFSLNRTELSDTIKRTVISISKDELRPAMTGLLFETDAKMVKVVSTDAHMLSSATFTDVQIDEELRVVVPARELNGATSVIENEQVKLSFYENFLKIDDGATYIYLQLIDAIFPNYRQVIPQSHQYAIEIDRDRLIGALRRIGNFANDQTNQITLTFDKKDGANRLTIGANDLDHQRSGFEVFDVQALGDRGASMSLSYPTAMNMGFNAKMLLSAVDSIASETITLLITEPNRPAIIKAETHSEDFVLVMPVVLQI